ncbi:MAG TPA: glycosyltransferase [Bacillota bacterium]
MKFFPYLDNSLFSWEVIISDDGSTDHSRELVRQIIAQIPKASLIENRHSGKPVAAFAGPGPVPR